MMHAMRTRGVGSKPRVVVRLPVWRRRLLLAVVLGGFVTMGIVAATAWKAPRLRALDLRDLQ